MALRFQTPLVPGQAGVVQLVGQHLQFLSREHGREPASSGVVANGGGSGPINGVQADQAPAQPHPCRQWPDHLVVDYDFPELALWRSVLMLAFEDASHWNELKRRKAIDWILSKSISVGSCRWVCDHIKVSHGAVVRRWTHFGHIGAN